MPGTERDGTSGRPIALRDSTPSIQRVLNELNADRDILFNLGLWEYVNNNLNRALSAIFVTM